ncbi:MAG TPA: hypothetical protein VKS20_11035 [Candidatus Acidoferrales bacterium]|nr:hypothetical protein [Candidatus Acidoferrales bacterium]
MAGRKHTLSIKKEQGNLAKAEQEKFTLEEAFDPGFEPAPMPEEVKGDHESRVQYWSAERGLRAIALLMDQATGAGNEPLEGAAAQGLSYLLKVYADDVRRLHAFSALQASLKPLRFSDILTIRRRRPSHT